MFTHRSICLTLILFLVGQLIRGANLSFAQSSAILTNEVILADEVILTKLTSASFTRHFLQIKTYSPGLDYGITVI